MQAGEVVDVRGRHASAENSLLTGYLAFLHRSAILNDDVHTCILRARTWYCIFISCDYGPQHFRSKLQHVHRINSSHSPKLDSIRLDEIDLRLPSFPLESVSSDLYGISQDTNYDEFFWWILSTFVFMRVSFSWSRVLQHWIPFKIVPRVVTS